MSEKFIGPSLVSDEIWAFGPSSAHSKHLQPDGSVREAFTETDTNGVEIREERTGGAESEAGEFFKWTDGTWIVDPEKLARRLKATKPPSPF